MAASLTRLPITRAAGWLVGVSVALVVIVAWLILNTRARDQINGIIDYRSRTVELLVRQDIENRLLALERFARRWTEAGGTPQAIWQQDAQSYISDMPGFQAIEWADASLHIIWIVPTQGNEAALNLNIAETDAARVAVTAARQRGRATLSQPFELAQGGPGIAAYTPVFREAQFDGVIVGVLALQPWLNTVFSRIEDSENQVYLSIDELEVYHNNAQLSSIESAWTERTTFAVQGLTFNLAVTPTNAFLSDVYSRASTIILSVGLLLSALLGLVVHLALLSRTRAVAHYNTADQLQTLLQNLPGGAYRLDPDAQYQVEFMSDGMQAVTGYPASDFVQHRISVHQVIHPEDIETVKETWSDAILTNQMYDFEYRIRAQGGDERWVWDRGRPVATIGTGQIRIEGFATDVTDRKLAKSKLMQAQSYSEAIVDAAIEAVITIDASDNIRRFNRAAQDMFGYSAEQAIGSSVLMVLPMQYHKEHKDYIDYFSETGELKYLFERREMELLRADGSIFPAYVSVNEIQHQQGEQQFVVLIRDISLERAAEQEAREQREQLAHVDRLNMLGEMASGIAHEVNQPLTAISLFSQAAMRLLDAGKHDRLPEVFEKLSEHAQRAGRVIERVQSMARRHESVKEIATCDVLIGETARLAEAEGRIRDIEIDVQVDGEFPPVLVDVVQIQQVLLNLLRNGMQAMQAINCRNGNRITIYARLEQSGEVEIGVIDSGDGVSEEAAKKLFTPFSTTKTDGMGMGLSISRAIVNAHGGRLDFYNTDGGGAVFYFRLASAENGNSDE